MAKELDQKYIAGSINIDPINVSGEYIRIPADLAFWGEQFADSMRALNMAKVTRDSLVAQVRLRYRNAYLDKGKKITEALLDNLVLADQDILNANKKVALLEADKAHSSAIVEAVRAKKDMLISLGAHIRAEMGHDPILRDQSKASREYQTTQYKRD